MFVFAGFKELGTRTFCPSGRSKSVDIFRIKNKHLYLVAKHLNLHIGVRRGVAFTGFVVKPDGNAG
jgi:hypothetical protein